MKVNILNKLLGKQQLNYDTIQATPSIPTYDDSDELEKLRDSYNQTPAHVRSDINVKQIYILANLFDMAYIAATAEDSFVLPQPIKFAHINRNSKRLEESNEKYHNDMEFTNRQFRKNLKACQKLHDRTESRDVLFEMIRKIYPDFALNYDKKISPEDLEVYLNNKKNLKRYIGVHKEIVYSEKASSEELLSNYCDSISSLIDTKEFSKACQIEDTFMLHELDIFFEKFAQLSDEEKQAFSSTKIKTSKGNNIGALKLATLLRNNRISRLEKYAQIESLYKKMDSHPFIKLDIDEKDDERFYYR